MSIKNLITQYLEKRGINDPAIDLTPDERITLEGWKKIMSNGEMTVDRIKEFCEYQTGLIEAQFRDPSKSDREKANLTLIYSVYSSVRNMIVSPIAEREALEKHLTSLIHSSDS